MTLMSDEELTTQLRIQDHSEMCLSAADRIEALAAQVEVKPLDFVDGDQYCVSAAAITTLRTQLAEMKAELARRVDMHECAMAERDDATLYSEEQKARADRAEAALAAQPSPDVAALVEALTIAANRLQRLAVEFDAGTRMFFEASEWADEARAALARVKGGAA